MLDRTLQKYDPSEPRDETGKWTSGGSGSGSSEAAPTSFISPNVSTLTFDQAVQALNSERQKQIAAASKEIDEGLGIKSQNYPAIGAWSDGAENSLMVVAPGASPAQIRVASAMKGYIADQKAVLTFNPNATGSDFLASFHVTGKEVGEIHDQLLKEGLSFHTLQPHGEYTIVHAYGSDQAAIDAVHKAATSFGADPEFIQGNGEFIGTKKEDGTDREQRDDARQQYEKVIQAASVSGELEGQDVGAQWQRIRDHWGAGAAGDGTGQQADSGEHAGDRQARSVDAALRARATRDPKVPKMFKQMTMAEASRTLPPALFRKYYMTAREFFDANKHLECDIDDLVIVVREWDESKHPRVPAGSPEGGEFGSGGGGRDSSGDTSASEAAPSKSNYGLTPGDKEKYDALRIEWAKINDDLLEPQYQDHPDSPESLQKVSELGDLVKQMHALKADPGDAAGIGYPGGPRDVLIVGAGPGGLTAGIHGGAEGYDTQVIEAQQVAGGQAKASSRIENYGGFLIGISGDRLMNIMHKQAERMGAEVTLGVRVTGMTVDDATGMKHVKLSNGETVDTRTVIIGGGAEFKKFNFPGADGPGVINDQNNEALLKAGKGGTIVVVGGANGAAQAALKCAKACEHVYVLSRSPISNGMSAYQIDALRANPKITVIEKDQIALLERDENGNPTTLKTKEGRTLAISAVGIYAGSIPETEWVPAQVPREKLKDGKSGRRLVTDTKLETAIPGVFAIGDMRENAVGRVVIAAGDGAMALRHAVQYLEDQKEAAGIVSDKKASATKRTIKKKPSDDFIDDIVGQDFENPWFGQTVDDVAPAKPVKKKSKKSLTTATIGEDFSESELELETRGSKKTVVELWPEEGESRKDFMDRCITGLSKCIGPKKAPGVCGTKWRRSEKKGKKKPEAKAFVARGLTDDEAIEACGETCVGCKGADAPFDLREYDANEPRDEEGKWTDDGGGEPEGGTTIPNFEHYSYMSTSEADKKVLRMYIENAYAFDMNQYLRGQTNDFSEADMAKVGKDTKTFIATYDRNAKPLEQAATLYRGVSAGTFKKLKVGDVFTDKGIVSTSSSKSSAEVFAKKGGIVITIAAPKGTRVIGGPSWSLEKELVLRPDTKFHVTARGKGSMGIEIVG